MFNSILKAFNRKKIDAIKKYASARGVPKATLDEHSLMQLMSYPEATVITILDNFKSLLSKGFSETEAISKIEALRSKANYGFGAAPPFIGDFVIYRIKIEHSNFFYLQTEENEHFNEVIIDYLNK